MGDPEMVPCAGPASTVVGVQVPLATSAGRSFVSNVGRSTQVSPSPIKPGPQMQAMHGGLLQVRSSRRGTQVAVSAQSGARVEQRWNYRQRARAHEAR